MTSRKSAVSESDAESDLPHAGEPGAETVQLLELASQLGQRDAGTLAIIVRRAFEICEAEGEDSALAVLDQIERILRGDIPDA